MRLKFRKVYSESGFTLLELIIVFITNQITIKIKLIFYLLDTYSKIRNKFYMENLLK